ncbi:MAG: TonB-dependent receptor [Ignavibacteriae bacterium]|nr:TonB-dependent receptor [Ignavibacteriota bacterium]
MQRTNVVRAILLLLLAVCVPSLMAAAGKIRGKVLDKETREVLVGANVSVEGSTMGAATDVEGEYIILNVPAGVYTLKATYVGYAPVSISNLRVNNDLTTTQDFTLASEAVSIQGVEIVAERPLVNKNATNAVRITTSEDIAAIPVRGINNVIALSAGVVLQDNTVFIRGGRQDEVGFYLDGVSITNPMLGGRAVNIVQDAVEEIQVQTGGYNAEFGNANSGIVQQQLKSGTSDWKLSAQYITDNVALKSKSKAFDGEKRLGSYWYGYNEFTGTVSGPVLGDNVKFFGLFNYLNQRDQTPQPYPGINLGTFVGQTGDTVNMNYPAGALLKNPIDQYSFTGTITTDLNPLTLRLSGIYNTQTTYNAYNSHRNAGQIANLLNVGRIEQVKAKNGSASVKLTHLLSSSTFYEVTAGYFFQTQTNDDPILEDNFLAYGDSVANAQAGMIWLRSANDIASGNVGRFVRPTRKTLYSFQFNAPGDVLAAYAKFKRENISLTGALSAQLGSEHSIKIGGEFQRYTMRNYAWTNDGVFSLAALLYQNDQLPAGDPNKVSREQVLINAGVNNFGYDVFGNELNGTGINAPKHPVFASAYVQDKIEYNDLVINAGLRFDYINSDNKALVDPSRPELTIDPTSGAINPAGLVDVPTFTAVSPRLGLSFPVTDRTVFHTQFGKFVQQSRLRDIYQGLYLTAANVRGGFFIGTPVGFDVRPTRTTQYEIGFTQQFGDFASFDITGYYKDIKDQVVFDQQNTAQGSPLGAYYVFKNGDFATTKGVELTFNMRRQKRLQVNASLAFQDAQGTGSFPNSARGIVGAPLDGVTLFKPQYISPLEFNNSIRGNVNLDYRFGADDGGQILERFGISSLVTFASGHPYTRGIGGASLEGEARSRQPIEALNASTTPWTFQIDLRIDKTVRLFDALDANFFLYVINLLDNRNIQNVFLRTGTTDDDGYLSNPTLGQPLINNYGPRFASLYKAINVDYYEAYQNAAFLNTVPYFFGPPRQVRFGVRLEY